MKQFGIIGFTNDPMCEILLNHINNRNVPALSIVFSNIHTNREPLLPVPR
jgi:hypothetical protein